MRVLPTTNIALLVLAFSMCRRPASADQSLSYSYFELRGDISTTANDARGGKRRRERKTCRTHGKLGVPRVLVCQGRLFAGAKIILQRSGRERTLPRHQAGRRHTRRGTFLARWRENRHLRGSARGAHQNGPRRARCGPSCREGRRRSEREFRSSKTLVLARSLGHATRLVRRPKSKDGWKSRMWPARPRPCCQPLDAGN